MLQGPEFCVGLTHTKKVLWQKELQLLAFKKEEKKKIRGRKLPIGILALLQHTEF
jgi:hypothetical protein